MYQQDKPQSMPLKEWLIKKLSQRLSVPHKVIELIVNEQFTEALKHTNDCNSIEFSGWGIFMFLPVKGQRTYKGYEEAISILEKMYNETEDEEFKRITKLKILTVQKNMEHLKLKLR